MLLFGQRGPKTGRLLDRFRWRCLLDFQLCVFVPDILNSLGVKNGLRISIFERFKAHGIEIPFPQQDVNLFVRGAPASGSEAAAMDARDVRDASGERPMPDQKAILESGQVPDGDDRGPGGEGEDDGQEKL